MLPASELNSPASCPIKVVLPAPFGPITACSSLAPTSSVIASAAMIPPKRFDRPSTASSASLTGCPRDESVEAAAREQHDQQQQRPEDDLPVLGDARERLLEHQQRDGPEQRPEQRAHAAQHHHDD